MDMIKLIIEVVFAAGLFFNAALFVPQAYKTYQAKDAGELSLAMFAGFNILQLFMALHGWLHQDFLLMWGMGFSLLTCGSVTLMILIYGRSKTA